MEEIFIKRREVFFNNLVLLGLVKTSLEKEHGIPFHKDMFVLPNKKGYEIVTYFLFSKLASATGKDYNIPWPLICKEHDRVFVKTCYAHLQDFAQENCVNFPRIVPSLLSTFGGNRFYEIYAAFSTYVLYKTIKKGGKTRLLSMPSVNQENFHTAKEILQLSTALNMKKFKNIQILSCCCHRIWLRFAKNLEESLRQLKLSLKSHNELIKKKKSVIFTLYPTITEGSFNLSKVIDMSLESLKPILKQRKILDKFLSSEQTYWKHLCSEVGDNAESEFLNGKDYSIQVIDSLPEEYVKELKSAGCLSSNENGKLSVERFIKIFMAYLSYTVDLLRTANLNELQRICFVEDASSIEDDLKCIKNLNKKLSDEVIPDITKNIEKLKVLSDYDAIEDGLESSGDLFCLLPNPSYDIDAVKQRTSHFDASLEITINSSLAIRSDEMESAKKRWFISEATAYHSESYLAGTKIKTCSTSNNLIDQNFQSSNSSSDRTIITDPNKLENRNLNAHCCVSTSDPSISKLSISCLDDLDLSLPKHFKMRDSWLKVESLDSMTLPDMSFDE